jgi:hypothetical protein
VVALSAALIGFGCRKPADHLAEDLVGELLDERLANPAKVAAIVSQRTGAAVRPGKRLDQGDERRQGLLGTDRFAWSGSVGSGSFARSVSAGWAWVSRVESELPEHSSARAAAAWIASSLASGGKDRDAPPFGVEDLAKALATLEIPDGQRWDSAALGRPEDPTLVLQSVPVDRVPGPGPVPWVLLAFRAGDPAGRAALARLAAAARLELAERPALFAFRSGADGFLRPSAPPHAPMRIADALPPPPSMHPFVSDAAVTYEGYDEIQQSWLGPQNRVVHRRKRLVRVHFDNGDRIVGLSAEVVQDDPAEYFAGGWYKSGQKDLLRQWRTFIANHTRKGRSSDVEPLRCAWPAFLPRPWWFEEPAELPVVIDDKSSYGSIWGAGGRLQSQGIHYAWFSIDDEGTIRYCVHQRSAWRQGEYRWVLGDYPDLEGKRYKGFPLPSRAGLPEEGRDRVTFYDGLVEFDAGMVPRISPQGSPFFYGPLFPEEEDPIVLRVLPATKADTRRAWGEIPK